MDIKVTSNNKPPHLYLKVSEICEFYKVCEFFIKLSIKPCEKRPDCVSRE